MGRIREKRREGEEEEEEEKRRRRKEKKRYQRYGFVWFSMDYSMELV